jgi:hypothetical protein
MPSVFTSTIANTLKKTLNKIVDDGEDGYVKKSVYPKYFDESSTEEAWVDDLEVGGPGLASDVMEGAEIPLGEIREGVMTRYVMRKIGLRLMVSDEAMDDCKYPEAIKAARRIKRAMTKTFDYDAANQLARAWDTNYPLGDGLPLCSASHTIPGGSTFSNTLAIPMSPSRAALIVVRAAVNKLPGHDGLIEGYRLEKILCPTEQASAWEAIIGSEKSPEPGNFSEINVTYKWKLDVVEVPYWQNTTTNWMVKTDCEDGLRWLWRNRMASKTYVENSNEVMVYQMSARYARGCSDARAVYGSQA